MIDFKSFGIGVHKVFDNLVEKIDKIDSKDILSKVDLIMDSCIACHNTYKLNSA